MLNRLFICLMEAMEYQLPGFVLFYILWYCILCNAFVRIFQTTSMIFNKKSSTDSVPLYWGTEFNRDSIAFRVKKRLNLSSINLSDFCAS